MIRQALSNYTEEWGLKEELQEMRRDDQANDYLRLFMDVHVGVGLMQSLHGETRRSDYRETNKMREEIHVCRDFIHRNNNSITEATVDTLFLTQPPPSMQAFFQNKDSISNDMQSNLMHSV
jgi:hypothetical protein